MTANAPPGAETIHRLVTTDIGGRGTIGPIAEAIAAAENTVPPLRAAERLVEVVSPGDVVLVLTGFPIPPAMVPETDGPIGAASLSRAIDRGLDANVVVAAGGGAEPVCEAAVTAAGLRVLDRDRSLESEGTAAVEPIPADDAAAAAYADDLDALNPAAIVTVELAGPNRADVYHNMAGYDVSEAAGNVEPIWRTLGESVPTIAVGDSGNEVGMGAIESTVRSSIPYGDDCQCGCGEGIGCALDADVLMPAAVSNWGAHAIVACLSLLDRDVRLHDAALERRLLREASQAGAVDGIDGGTTGWCDGLPPAAHGAIVRLLGRIVDRGRGGSGGGEFSRTS